MKQLSIYGSREGSAFHVAAVSYDGQYSDSSTLLMAMNVLRNRGEELSDVMRWDVHNWDEKVWG